MEDYPEHHGHDHYDYRPYDDDDDDWNDDNDDYDNVFTLWYFWLVIIIVMGFFITCIRSCYQKRCCGGSNSTERTEVAYLETTRGEFAPPPNPGTFNHAFVMRPHMLSQNGSEPKPEDLPPSYQDAVGYPVVSPPEVEYPVVFPPEVEYPLASPPEVQFPVISPPEVAVSPPPSAPEVGH